MSSESPQDPTPRPVLSPKAQAALAEVRRKRGRRKSAAPREVPSGQRVRWGMLLMMTIVMAAGVGYLRLKANENLARVQAENERIAAMERAYGTVTQAPESFSGASEPAHPDSPSASDPSAAPMRVIPRPPPGWRSELALEPNCRLRSAEEDPIERAPMYKWRDASGSLQFGRSPPAGVNAQRVAVSDGNRAQFKLTVGAGDGSPVPSQLRDRATADIYRIVAILRQELGVPVASDFNLNLSFVSRLDDVGKGLGLSGAAGVYMPLEQRMEIWRQPDDEGTFATLRHESVHALLHEFVGAPPIWLNEGLAEYLENLRVSGSSGTVGVNRDHRQLLQTMLRVARVDAAMAMLDANANQFRQPDRRDLNYALAWSLVHYLMSTESGQGVFGELLAEIREAGCRRFSSKAFFDRKFTGGARDFVTRAVAATADKGHYY